MSPGITGVKLHGNFEDKARFPLDYGNNYCFLILSRTKCKTTHTSNHKSYFLMDGRAALIACSLSCVYVVVGQKVRRNAADRSDSSVLSKNQFDLNNTFYERAIMQNK